MDRKISAEGLIKTLSGLLPRGCEAYVVGGTVRDILLGRACSDIDLAVSCPPGELAARAAAVLGGSAFAMDAGRDVHRVAFGPRPAAQLDMSALKGNIYDDLAFRDFTVDAMAAPLAEAAGLSELAGGALSPSVIDPFGGRDDLGAGVIRALGREVLAADPLRLLRAFRLSVQLGFTVDGETLSHIGVLAPAIAGVSAERVRDEVYLMVSADGSAAAFRGMEASGLLGHVMPETVPMKALVQGAPHTRSLLDHSLETMARSEYVMGDTARFFGMEAAKVDAFLDTRPDGGVTMRGLVKLCALLHDTGKPGTMTCDGARPRFIGHEEAGARINGVLARRLRVSARARGALVMTAALHMRPLGLGKARYTGRALHRLARDAGEFLPALAVVALADALATGERPGEEFPRLEAAVCELVGYYYGRYMEAKVRPVLTGGDVMASFGLPPGPEVGRILREVEERRAEGDITGREDALAYVAGQLGRRPG